MAIQERFAQKESETSTICGKQHIWVEQGAVYQPVTWRGSTAKAAFCSECVKDWHGLRWLMASGLYETAETALSTRHTVKGSLESEGWDQPIQMEGIWAARSGEGMILSDSEMSVTINQETYKLSMAYIKDLPEG
ncbi:hypothetical protein J6590_006038 [Homalodisca vitripennis]|nr:hypothetical protein J6590_006038 [Homalodisca vitripennis]